MGWLDYEPQAIDFQYWCMQPESSTHRVSLWPQPNSTRVDARYRMQWGKDCLPSAQRFMVRNRLFGVPPPPLPANVDLWAWLDLLPISGGHIEGILPANPDGIVLRMSVQSFDTLPSSGVKGVRVEIEQSIVGFGSLLYWEEYWHGEFETQWTPTAENWVSGGNVQGFVVDPLWPYNVNQQRYQSASECYDFPRQSIEVQDFARFNGVDAYIALDHLTISNSGPFFAEADVRTFARIANPIMGISTANSGWQSILENLFWGPSTVAVNDLPADGTFYKLRTEFEWELGTQLTYQTFVDDVLVHQVTTNRNALRFDQLGKRNSGGSAVFGHFDMRNLTYKTGTFAAPIVRLAMPLQINALDSGPDANHGTTFNMELPSV